MGSSGCLATLPLVVKTQKLRPWHGWVRYRHPACTSPCQLAMADGVGGRGEARVSAACTRLPYPNFIVEHERQKRAYSRHQDTLRHVQASVDMKQPFVPEFLSRKLPSSQAVGAWRTVSFSATSTVSQFDVAPLLSTMRHRVLVHCHRESLDSSSRQCSSGTQAAACRWVQASPRRAAREKPLWHATEAGAERHGP